MYIHKTPELDFDIESLKAHGFVRFKYPPSLRHAMNLAMGSWQLFCSLPQEKKNLLAGGSRKKDFGYMLREDMGPKEDDKELFHALRENFSLLIPMADKIRDQRATEFIRAVDMLILRMENSVWEFAWQVEKLYGLLRFTDEVMAAKDRWTFRYLRYSPGSQLVLANGHIDQGGFTYHLGETEGGGEYFGFDRTWRPWPVSSKETIIFPGVGLQFRSECQLKALWHQVVPKKTTTTKGRYSMVAFIDFESTVTWDTENFRMREFEAGFNYDISLEELAKYFISR